ncbi:MAG: HupE/UreJ family protein, partial [Betaproteobacteria bacterium]|nr:HupE/UreJ family protein [Betaproteobacteria bacterium]
MLLPRPASQGAGRFLAWLLAVVLGVGIVSTPASAHDIPEQIVLRGFVKPEGERLHFLVRVPLAMLLSMNLPKRGLGYLDLSQIDERLQASAAATAKEIVLYEDGVRLVPSRTAARISQPSDRSFETYANALANIAGPKLPDTTDVFWNQGFFDTHLEYPIRSARSEFSLDMRLAPGLRGRLKLFVRFLPPDEPARAYELHGGAGLVMLDPRWHQAAWSFVKFGFFHILDGLDHLLFLFCLVLPFRRVGWTLVAVATSFTVAHSITLIAAAYGIAPRGAWFPPLVEALIAASIIYMALENVLRPNLRWRWLVTAAFGLVHGFGFSFVLQNQLQFSGDHLLLSLLAFNVGIELGQLLFIVLALPLLALLFNTVPLGERLITAVISAFVIHTAWHWLAERWDTLKKVEWPAVDPATLAVSLIAAVALGALAWVLLGRPAVLRRRDAKAGA